MSERPNFSDNAAKQLEALSKEWSFLTGVGYISIPEDDSNEAKLKALVSNQLELFSRISTLRRHILNLDRRLRNSEERKGKWWNR